MFTMILMKALNASKLQFQRGGGLHTKTACCGERLQQWEKKTSSQVSSRPNPKTRSQFEFKWQQDQHSSCQKIYRSLLVGVAGALAVRSDKLLQ